MLLLPLLALLSCIAPSSASPSLDGRDLLNVGGMQAEIVSNASDWHQRKRAPPLLSPGWVGESNFALAGVTGVSAMQVRDSAFPSQSRPLLTRNLQISVLDDDHVRSTASRINVSIRLTEFVVKQIIIFDKAESNALKLPMDDQLGQRCIAYRTRLSGRSVSSPIRSLISLFSRYFVDSPHRDRNTDGCIIYRFCAGGGWLGNGQSTFCNPFLSVDFGRSQRLSLVRLVGTMVSVGGNPREGWPGTEGVNNGLMAIRLITPGANASTATVLEVPARLHLTSPRWYASTVRLTDGSMMILCVPVLL